MATTCYAVAIQPAVSEEKSYAQSEISMGNGESNWIITEGMIRDGASFTFPEVKIKGNGWLVMHPFTDGKPDGKIYVGHTYILDGINSDVDISVEPTPSSGDMFIVMLHRDVDEDREFDFVFVDENHVEDRAVFEGSTMIAHVIAAP
ncbi:MAG: hypothetical protein MRY72_12335 [Aquisalinus sp.]|nr:hypothetical protein [Aquisalinus sp.]